MKNVFLDLREHALRVLVIENEAVTYVKGFAKFSLDEPGNAEQVLAEISRDAGVKLDRVHCIMSSEEVSVSTYRLPAMSLADADKVIRRRLIKETGVPSPLFSILPTGSGGEKQTYLVETIKQETIERYVNFFRSRKIMVKTISTALHANLKALKKFTSELLQTTAILDIGNDIIEMTVFSHDHVVSYGKAAIIPLDVEKELQSGKTLERINKMRVYRVVESVFNAQSDYNKDFPDAPIQNLWVCGTGGALEGLHDALIESMNVAVAPLNTFKETIAEGYQFTALHGLALALSDRTAVNYLTRKMEKQLSAYAFGRTAVITTACIYVLVIIATTGLLELKHKEAKQLLEEKTRAEQARRFDSRDTDPYFIHGAYLKSVLARQVSWYEVLGYLADNTPDGVYINGLALKQQSALPLLEIDFVSPYSSEVGGHKVLTKIVAMIDRFRPFRRIGEPILSVTKQEKNKLFHFKVTCEVTTVEKAN
jgi:hypothetical protein